jgi:DNA-binding transcriptional MerR regulator
MFKIGEFARIVGVSLRALRHYEEVGLLQPQRQGNEYRLYTASDLERMRRILALRELGFPLERIRVVLQGISGGAYLEMLRAHQTELSQEIRRLQAQQQRLEVMLLRAQEVQMYSPEIRSIPAQKVLAAKSTAQDYRHVSTPMQALGKMLWTHLQTSNARSVSPDLVIWGGNYGDMESFSLEWIIPVEGEVAATPEIQVYTLPAIPEMGVVRHVGDYEQLGEAYAALAAWLEAQGYERTGNLREVYVHYDQDRTQNITEVQVPVRKKQQ